MTLENKYNVPKETLKQMCQDGVISSSVLRHYEIYDLFHKIKKEYPARSNSAIICQMADDLRLSTATIDRIVYTLHKK